MKRQKDTKILNTIGDKLKAVRLEKDLTQQDVAKKAGINGNYYAKVERGEASLSVITLLKLLKALDLKSSDILPY
jgi:transcriptional regulator with XRE-family HTH domain